MPFPAFDVRFRLLLFFPERIAMKSSVLQTEYGQSKNI